MTHLLAQGTVIRIVQNGLGHGDLRSTQVYTALLKSVEAGTRVHETPSGTGKELGGGIDLGWRWSISSSAPPSAPNAQRDNSAAKGGVSRHVERRRRDR